jgi:hypothetical protein
MQIANFQLQIEEAAMVLTLSDNLKLAIFNLQFAIASAPLLLLFLRSASASIAASPPAAAAAAAAVAAPATAAAAAAAFGLGTGLVDGEGPAIDFLAIEGGNGGLGLGVRVHLDEAEPLGATGVAVHDDLSRLHCTVRLEELL